jgi:DNA mismatch repair ATPase MutS
VHFRENLGSKGMVFDYKLHEGPAVTRNALLILEREGYPRSLMDVAHHWHDEQAGAKSEA